jgi:hypothetical protein
MTQISKNYDDGTTELVDEQVVFDIIDLNKAKAFVSSELPVADINIFYHEDTDTRAVATLQDWRDYRKALRDYVQADAIVGSQPVRPT